MVDKDTKDVSSTDDASNSTAHNVADLHIAEIIAALHQTALQHSNAAAKGVRITNSAIDDESGKSSIKSAGEHIISVIPLEEDQLVQKKTAVEVLKEYVQWFVGPDLAKKVDDSTVKSLTESPLKENQKHFMSFKQFLNEETKQDDTSEHPEPTSDASGDTPAEGEQDKPTNGDDNPEESKNDPKNDEEANKDNKEDKDEDSEKTDENVESKVGYYIPYSLKVEGLKQTALKDAMKKFAKTFFDDVKFTASGLFGSGDSFTVKDVKDKWNEVFGPIDPDDLVEKVRKEIEDIKHPNTDPPNVRIRDKKTLISDLGNVITGKQKQQIDQAKYSLWISLQEYDPKKPLFNPRIVADIVTSSMKGLWKKFKNKITKDDVIFIENYSDTHEDTEALRKLQDLVPKIPEILSLIDKAQTASDAFKKIKDKIDAVAKDKQYKNSHLALACVKVWNEFADNHNSDAEIKRMTSIRNDAKDDFFKPFVDAYKKTYDKYYDKKLRESLDVLNQMMYVVNVKKLVLESLFNEDDNTEELSKDDAKEKKNVSFDKIKRFSQQYVKPEPKLIHVDAKDQIIKMCEILDTSAFKNGAAFGEFQNGILVDYTGQIDVNKSLSESIRDDIFSILDIGQNLTEDETENKDSDSDARDAKDDSQKKTTQSIDENALKSALLKALEKNGISQDECGELIVLSPEMLNESKLSDYIEKHNLSKKDALKPETIADLKKNVFLKKGEKFIKGKINEYFTKKSSSKDKDSGKQKDKPSDDKQSSLNSSRPREVFGQQNSNDIISDIEKQFTEQLKGLDNKLAETITGLFGSIDYIKETLNKAKIFDEKIQSISDSKEYKYAFAIPIQLPYKDNSGKMIRVPRIKKSSSGETSKVCQGTQGASKINDQNALESMKASLKNKKISEQVEDFFTYEKDSTNWNYFNTKQPAKCKVYIGFIKNIDDPGSGPGPGPGPGSDKTSNDKAYVLPFGKENFAPKPPDDDIDDVDISDEDVQGRTDLYIIPIKNMNYKDKEYDTYA